MFLVSRAILFQNNSVHSIPVQAFERKVDADELADEFDEALNCSLPCYLVLAGGKHSKMIPSGMTVRGLLESLAIVAIEHNVSEIAVKSNLIDTPDTSILI